MKVMIVEDEPLIRELAAMIVAQTGHEVVQMETADTAIEYLNMHDVDMILTDNDMPSAMGGVKRNEGMRVIEFAHTLPNRPFIVWTSGYASGDPVLCKKALDTGADQVLFKPFHYPEFKCIIERAAARKTLEVMPI